MGRDGRFTVIFFGGTQRRQRDVTSHRGRPGTAKTYMGNGRGKQEAIQSGEDESPVGRQPLQDAGYQALKLYHKRLRKELAGLRHVDDADTIHDARVAVRELRAIASLLQPSGCFAKGWLRRMDSGLRRLAHGLGEVRDTDVLLEHLHAYVSQHEEAAEGLSWLEEELGRRRARAARRVRKLVKEEQTYRLLKKTRRDFRRQRRHMRVSSRAGAVPATTSRKDKAEEEPYPILVRHFAGGAIWERYQEILKYEMALPQASAQTLHGLRIACKRLRYSMQIFGQTPAELVETLAALKGAQDHLGRLHDIFFAERLIARLLPRSGGDGQGEDQSSPANHPQYLEYLEALTTESNQLRSSIGPLWARLTGLPMRQRICGYIASL
jgi:CHAD domain-containing protein